MQKHLVRKEKCIFYVLYTYFREEMITSDDDDNGLNVSIWLCTVPTSVVEINWKKDYNVYRRNIVSYFSSSLFILTRVSFSSHWCVDVGGSLGGFLSDIVVECMNEVFEHVKLGLYCSVS